MKIKNRIEDQINYIDGLLIQIGDLIDDNNFEESKKFINILENEIKKLKEIIGGKI